MAAKAAAAAAAMAARPQPWWRLRRFRFGVRWLERKSESFDIFKVTFGAFLTVLECSAPFLALLDSFGPFWTHLKPLNH